MQKLESWRVGDAGHTIFGPPNGTPCPEVIATLKSKKHARLIAAAPELLEALQTLAAYANGKLGKNPYCIPEYKQALCAIGKATGKNTDGDAWMDANNEAYTTHAKATGR